MWMDVERNTNILTVLTKTSGPISLLQSEECVWFKTFKAFMQQRIQFDTSTIKLIKPVKDLWPTIIAQYQHFQ